jgi:hypothetical protein
MSLPESGAKVMMINKSAEYIFERKRERRCQLAKLPFENKIEIIVKLQQAVGEIKKDPRRRPWPL